MPEKGEQLLFFIWVLIVMIISISIFFYDEDNNTTKKPIFNCKQHFVVEVVTLKLNK
jgi:hypothetical protein